MMTKRCDPLAVEPTATQRPLNELYSLSIAETRRRTGIPRSTIYELINSGRLETFTLGRRRFVIVASLMQLINGQQNTPPKPK